MVLRLIRQWKYGIAAAVVALVFAGAIAYAKMQPRPDVRLVDYRGRWVLINVWAGWCAPCMDELPVLDTFYHVHHDKVMVFGLSYDHLNKHDLQLFSKQHHLTYPLISYLPLSPLGVNEIPQVPMTLVISPQGKLVHTLMGPQNKEQLLAAVAFLKARHA